MLKIIDQLLAKQAAYATLELDSALTDFEDGELKTNKAFPSGLPKETMFITQTSKSIDSLIGSDATSFEASNLYTKIRNLVYLPVVKDSANAGYWYFTHCIHIQAEPGSVVFERLRADYDAVRTGLVRHLSTSADGFIHTTNGVNSYLQVRSKDSKPYHPIYSAHFGRYVSNKNHAFYFMKPFLRDAVAGVFKL